MNQKIGILTDQLFFRQQIERYTNLRNEAARRVFLLGTIRLVVFILILVSWFFLDFSIVLSSLTIGGISVFLYLVHLGADARYEKLRSEKLVRINESELKVLNGDWSSFRDGGIYKDPSHPFSADMDLFGPRSLFQLLNRTVSKKGEQLLARQLTEGTDNTELTRNAILELSEQVDWSQQFLAEGMVFLEADGESDLRDLKEVMTELTVFEKVLIYLVPFISLSSILLWSLGLINGVLFSTVLALILGLVMRSMKNTNKLCLEVGRYDRLVAAYLRQVELIDKVEFRSSQMQEWKRDHFGTKGEVSISLLELERIQKHMNYRLNLVVAFLLNFLFAWDLRVKDKWMSWHKRNALSLAPMEDRLAELEVWISGAFYFNRYPRMVFAEFSDANKFNISDLGHPFIPNKNQVLNDLDLRDNEKFYIVTGPNMAGKSTYLRSVGWAVISANAGFPVLASACKLPRLKLYTSMRTADDLNEQSSFFYAELKRLRFIMDAIERGEEVFVILDEILKGTNSKDKEEGSAGLLRKLAGMNAHGIIATHDLSLCRLAEGSSEFRNRYFDSRIENDQLHFDYKIRDGICQNMNASFLLNKMGLV